MSGRPFRKRAIAANVTLAVSCRPDARHLPSAPQRLVRGPKDDVFQVSSHAFRWKADAAGGREMKKLIKCLFCGWIWFGRQGDCQICQQCRFAPYPDSIGG
jgi:hypothetical protein